YREIIKYLADLKIDNVSYLCLCSLAYNGIPIDDYIIKYKEKHVYSCLCLRNSYSCRGKDKCNDEWRVDINLFVDSVVLFYAQVSVVNLNNTEVLNQQPSANEGIKKEIYRNKEKETLKLCCINSLCFTATLLIKNTAPSMSLLTLKFLPEIFASKFDCEMNKVQPRNIKIINTSIVVELLFSVLTFNHLKLKGSFLKVKQTVLEMFNELVYRATLASKVLKQSKTSADKFFNDRLVKEMNKIQKINRIDFTEVNIVNCLKCCYKSKESEFKLIFLLTQQILFDAVFINYCTVEFLVSFLEKMRLPLSRYVDLQTELILSRLMELENRPEMFLDLLVFFDLKTRFDVSEYLIRRLEKTLLTSCSSLVVSNTMHSNTNNTANISNNDNKLFLKTLQYLNKMCAQLSTDKASQYFDILIRTIRTIYCNNCLNYEIKLKTHEYITDVNINPVHFIKECPSVTTYILNLMCHHKELEIKEPIHNILMGVLNNSLHWSVILLFNKIEPIMEVQITIKDTTVSFSTLLLELFFDQNNPSEELAEVAVRVCSTPDEYKRFLNCELPSLNFLRNVIPKEEILIALENIFSEDNSRYLFIVECISLLIESVYENISNYKKGSEFIKLAKQLLSRIEEGSDGYCFTNTESIISDISDNKKTHGDNGDKPEEKGLKIKAVDCRFYSKIDEFYISDELVNQCIENGEAVLLIKEFVYNERLVEYVLDMCEMKTDFVVRKTKDSGSESETTSDMGNGVNIRRSLNINKEIYNLYLATFILKYISKKKNFTNKEKFFFFFTFCSPFLSFVEVSRGILAYSDRDFNQLLFVTCMDRFSLNITNDLINRIIPLLLQIRADTNALCCFKDYVKYNMVNLMFILHKLLYAPSLLFRMMALKIRPLIMDLLSSSIYSKNIEYETSLENIHESFTDRPTKILKISDSENTRELNGEVLMMLPENLEIRQLKRLESSVHSDFLSLIFNEPKIEFTEGQVESKAIHKLRIEDFENNVLPEVRNTEFCNLNALRLFVIEYRKVLNNYASPSQSQQDAEHLLNYYNRLAVCLFKNIKEVDYEFAFLLPIEPLAKYTLEAKMFNSGFYKVLVVVFRYFVNWLAKKSEKHISITASDVPISNVVQGVLPVNILSEKSEDTAATYEVLSMKVFQLISNISNALSIDNTVKVPKQELFMFLILSIKYNSLRKTLSENEAIDIKPFMLETSTFFKNEIFSLAPGFEKTPNIYKIVYPLIDIDEIYIKSDFFMSTIKELNIPHPHSIYGRSYNISQGSDKSLCFCAEAFIFNTSTANGAFKNSYIKSSVFSLTTIAGNNNRCLTIQKLIFEKELFKEIKESIRTYKIVDIRNTENIFKTKTLALFKYLKNNEDVYIKRNIKWFVLQILQIYIAYLENKPGEDKYYLINNTRSIVSIELFNELIKKHKMENWIFLRQIIDILYFFNECEIIKLNRFSFYLNTNSINTRLYLKYKETPLKHKKKFLKENILNFDQHNDKHIFSLINKSLNSKDDLHEIKYSLNLNNFINSEYDKFRKLLNKKNSVTFYEILPPMNYETSKFYILNYQSFSEKALLYSMAPDETSFKELYQIYFQRDGQFPLVLNKFESFNLDSPFHQRFEYLYKNYTDLKYTTSYQYLIRMIAKMACYNERPEYSLELLERVTHLPFVEGSYLLYHYLYSMMTYNVHFNDEDYMKCLNKKSEFGIINLHFFNYNIPSNVDAKSLYFFQLATASWLINRLKHIVYNLEEPIASYLKTRQTVNKAIYKTKTRNEKMSINIIEVLKSQIFEIENLLNCALKISFICEATFYFIELYLFYPKIRLELDKNSIDSTNIDCYWNLNPKMIEVFVVTAIEALRFDSWIFLYLIALSLSDNYSIEQEEGFSNRAEYLALYFFKGILKWKDFVKFLPVMLVKSRDHPLIFPNSVEHTFTLQSLSTDEKITAGDNENNNRVPTLHFLISALAKEINCKEHYFYVNTREYAHLFKDPVFEFINKYYNSRISRKIGATFIQVFDKIIKLTSQNETRTFKIENYTSRITKGFLEKSNLAILFYSLFMREETNLVSQEDLKSNQLKKSGFNLSVSKTIILDQIWLREVGEFDFSSFGLNSLKKRCSKSYINYRVCLTELTERYSSLKSLNEIFGMHVDESMSSFSVSDERVVLNCVLVSNVSVNEETWKKQNILDKLVREHYFVYSNINSSIKEVIKGLEFDGKLSEIMKCYFEESVYENLRL
ncbi:hypothetical protein CDIK_0498, partial [Cucumispora dikerogammari]